MRKLGRLEQAVADSVGRAFQIYLPEDVTRLPDQLSNGPVRVCHLLPGDCVDWNGFRGTMICRTQHPLWPTLELVVWRLGNGDISFDALDRNQEIGTIVASGNDSLRKALGIQG